MVRVIQDVGGAGKENYFVSVLVSDGDGAPADVRIESDGQTFMSLFRNPNHELFNELERQRKIRITSLTKKGKDAEGYIRRYFAG